MGSVALFELRFLAFFLCAILLSFPTLSFAPPNNALPRMLLVNHGRHHSLARPPPCETNCSNHFERLLIKSTPSQPSSSSCKQTYGVMPCTHSIIGGIFLLLAYSYIIFRAARLLVQGSELLLLVLGSSIVGGLLLPLFGVLPDSILVLVSGIGGGNDEAQKEVLIGIGLLAGSNVMLLSLLWGTCLILGRCDLSQDQNGNLYANDTILNNKLDLSGTGVEVDKPTQFSAGIMCTSIIPLLVVQVPHMFHFTKGSNIPILIACLLSFGAIIPYCVYQVTVPYKQKKLKALQDVVISNLLPLRSEDIELIDKDGHVNEEVFIQMFDKLDLDNDNQLSLKEVRAILTISAVNKKLHEDVLEHFMKDFDTDANDTISRDEFLAGIRRWCKDMKPSHIYSLAHSLKVENSELQEVMEYSRASRGGDNVIRKSIMLILVGTLLVSLFAEPLVDAVDEFARSSHIPSFFVSFVLLPLASNTSESISSIIFSSRKKKINMSLTYSQIYGAVTLNNTLGLGILLAIIYARHLVWEFSSEVLIICLVTLVIGAIGLIRRVLPLWIAILALLIYPVSIGLVAILDYILHWN